MVSPFSRFSIERTPYSVVCSKNCGDIYLSEKEYIRQLNKPDARWECPKCNSVANWDDDNYESFTGEKL
jgi:uncharacterized C2H2 Zn-finger protein